jgi:hypothetical protein
MELSELDKKLVEKKISLEEYLENFEVFEE